MKEVEKYKYFKFVIDYFSSGNIIKRIIKPLIHLSKF